MKKLLFRSLLGSLCFASMISPAFAALSSSSPIIVSDVAKAAKAVARPVADPACWTQAAAYHNVDVWLLYSIASVESSFNPAAVNKNTNGSFDLGMMQINTIWLKKLSSFGIQPVQLLDGCTSIYVGAWILSQTIKQYGYNWRGIGAYNSGKPHLAYKYAQKVYATHSKITGIAIARN